MNRCIFREIKEYIRYRGVDDIVKLVVMKVFNIFIYVFLMLFDSRIIWCFKLYLLLVSCRVIDFELYMF